MADRGLITLLAWGLLFLPAGPAQAEPDFDRSFGLNGRVAVELGQRNSGHAVLVQADGKILVAGSVSDGAGLNFSLLRFNRDGSLDPTFNGDGAVTTRVSPGDDEILALGLLADGRIIAAGYSHNGTDRDFALACYRPDGSLDPFFGRGGLALTAVGNRNEEINALVIDRQDRITVAGPVEGTAGRVLATARYESDGEPDPSYGESGLSLVGVGADVAIKGMIKRPDGTLVVAGSSSGPQGSALMLVGLSLNGNLDRNFGVQGVMRPGVVKGARPAVSEGYRLALDSQGCLLVAGSVGVAGKRDAALFRFTADGKADPGFGTQGVLVTRVSEEDDALFDLTLSKTGLVASGYTTVAGCRQLLLLTIAVPLVAAPESVTASFSEGESVGHAVTLDSDGRMIVVGTAQGSGVSSLVAARFADGAGDSRNQAEGAGVADDAAGSQIVTTEVTEITQTSAAAGGEINPGLAPTVVRRGVVFSAVKTPYYPATTGAGTAAIGVSEGEAAAGSGTGSFAVSLTGLKPATSYAYRAYGLAADGTVTYGNQLRFTTADACFVATASFGTLFHPSVKILRDFRDTFLLGNGPGRRMVALYYRLSPSLAEGIGQNESLRLMVRVLLLPAVGFAWLALRIGLAWTLLALGGAALILARGSIRGWSRR